MARQRRILLAHDAFGEEFNLSPGARERLGRLGELLEVATGAADADDQIMGLLPTVDALLVAGWETPVPRLHEDALAAAGRLSFIGCHQNNRWRFLEARAASGVALVDGSPAMAPAVAEFGLALILCSLRDIPAHHASIAAGGWCERFDDREAAGGTLRGRRVGLVGFGRIAAELRELLRPFRCRVSACSGHLDTAAGDDLGVEVMALDRLMAWSDVVVVTQAATRENRHLVGRESIRRMRPGSLLVSLSRGWLVDTDAALARVRDADLRFAADVYEDEPLPRDHPLRGMDGVVHTPHVAGRTVWASQRVFDVVVDDYERHLAGVAPHWPAR